MYKNDKNIREHSNKLCLVMEECSTIIIKRKRQSDIYLWTSDRSIGAKLCVQLKTLLEKYTIEEIIAKIESLILCESYEYQSFNVEDFVAFIEGNRNYMNDECLDVEYTYTINLFENYVDARCCKSDERMFLSFDDIVKGYLFENNES